MASLEADCGQGSTISRRGRGNPASPAKPSERRVIPSMKPPAEPASVDLPGPVRAFLAAVNDRDAAAAARCFTEGAEYHATVPHPSVAGTPAIEAMFARIFGEAERVRWEVVATGEQGSVVFVERLDRFWYSGHEAAIECCGVFVLDGDRIATVRDYLDLPTWRARKSAALRG
jgi:limonene-1,2-epoxide hydrolase